MERRKSAGRRYCDQNRSCVVLVYGFLALLYFTIGFLVGRYCS